MCVCVRACVLRRGEVMGRGGGGEEGKKATPSYVGHCSNYSKISTEVLRSEDFDILKTETLLVNKAS